MSYYLATKTSIADWIKGLASGNNVYFPAKHGQSSYRFTPVKPDSDIQFEGYTPTVVPPVKLLLPAREELLQFRKNTDGKNEVRASLDTSFRIIAGVRSCDLKGIFLMDLFFKDGSPDAYYLARRENTAIIGYACNAPCDPRAFCAAVESLDHTEGADVFVTPLSNGDALVEVKTELGKKLTDGAGWKPCDKDPRGRKAAAVRAPARRCGQGHSEDSCGQIPEPGVGKARNPLLLLRHVQSCLSHLLLLRRR